MSLTLARFKARVRLVDNVDTPATPHDLTGLVAFLERFQGVNDFHDNRSGGAQRSRKLVEPAAPVNIGGPVALTTLPGAGSINRRADLNDQLAGAK